MADEYLEETMPETEPDKAPRVDPILKLGLYFCAFIFALSIVVYIACG